jgi:hypothetical protein
MYTNSDKARASKTDKYIQSELFDKTKHPFNI